MKKMKNLEGTRVLSKSQQKRMFGGSFTTPPSEGTCESTC